MRPNKKIGFNVYSNFDREMIAETMEELKGNPNKFYSQHSAWNFCGYIWFDGKLWQEDVWVYSRKVGSYSNENLKILIDSVNNEYGIKKWSESNVDRLDTIEGSNERGFKVKPQIQTDLCTDLIVTWRPEENMPLLIENVKSWEKEPTLIYMSERECLLLIEFIQKQLLETENTEVTK